MRNWSGAAFLHCIWSRYQKWNEGLEWLNCKKHFWATEVCWNSSTFFSLFFPHFFLSEDRISRGELNFRRRSLSSSTAVQEFGSADTAVPYLPLLPCRQKASSVRGSRLRGEKRLLQGNYSRRCFRWSSCEGPGGGLSSSFKDWEAGGKKKETQGECCTKNNECRVVAFNHFHICSVEFSFDERFWLVFGILKEKKSGSRDFATMRNTWLSPRSAILEYWTSLIACLFWIQHSCGMPHVIRIGKLSTFWPFVLIHTV